MLLETNIFLSDVSVADQTQEARDPKCLRDTKFLEVGPAVFGDGPGLGPACTDGA